MPGAALDVMVGEPVNQDSLRMQESTRNLILTRILADRPVVPPQDPTSDARKIRDFIGGGCMSISGFYRWIKAR